jgi:hypothetical protein
VPSLDFAIQPSEHFMPSITVAVFAALAVIYGGLAVQDFRRNQQLSIAGIAYRRVTVIFAIVAGLQVVYFWFFA